MSRNIMWVKFDRGAKWHVIYAVNSDRTQMLNHWTHCGHMNDLRDTVVARSRDPHPCLRCRTCNSYSGAILEGRGRALDPRASRRFGVAI